jgi:hypothetical protein
MSKFGRNYKILVQVATDEVVTVKMPTTINFTVSRNVMSSANSLSLSIYNLAEKTRSKLFKDRYDTLNYKQIIFLAGYGDQLTEIFRGNIFECHSERQGSDIITRLEAKDGGLDVVNTFSSKSFSANTSKEDLINNLIADFKVVKKGIFGALSGENKRGKSLLGNTYGIIRRETNELVYIDLEKINILKNNEVIIGDMPKITSSNGLLAVPQRQNTYLQADLMFEPRLKLSQLIDIESSIQKQFNGQFKIIGISHSGTISKAVCGQCKTGVQLLIGGLESNPRPEISYPIQDAQAKQKPVEFEVVQ